MTIKDSPNYGGILQAYALQYKLKKLGYECALIDYMNDEFRNKFAFFGKPKDMKTIYWIYKKIQYPLMVHMMSRMMPFYQHMSVTKHFQNREDLALLNSDYDAFITGSDQVWACDLNNYDNSYFLGFVDDSKPKIAYAASFGRTFNMLTPREKEFIAANLGRLDSIGLREKSSIEIVKMLGGKESCAVLDPTLLLNRADWMSVGKINNREPYILCYLMQSRKNDSEALKQAKKIAKEKNLKVVKICRGLTSVLWGETIYVPTVEEWIGLFANASYIATNSFHGVAFSAIFNVDFTAYIEGKPSEGRNSRIYDLSTALGLLSRIKVVGKDETVDTSKIDYTIVNRKLEKLRAESIRFLEGALTH